MQKDSDLHLIERALGGEEPALERLIVRHYPATFRLAFRWSRNREDAEDITQEVFVKMAASLETFRRGSAFSTWLCRITINTAKDFHRNHETRRRLKDRFAAEVRNNPVASPEEAVSTQQIYELLDKLPEKQKAAVLLVCAEGLSHKEAARVLQCAETTVSWRIFQGRKKLHRWMGKQDRQ